MIVLSHIESLVWIWQCNGIFVGHMHEVIAMEGQFFMEGHYWMCMHSWEHSILNFVCHYNFFKFPYCLIVSFGSEGMYVLLFALRSTCSHVLGYRKLHMGHVINENASLPKNNCFMAFPMYWQCFSSRRHVFWELVMFFFCPKYIW